MSTDFNEIENLALKLDGNHRAELAKRLLASLDQKIDQEIEQAWVDEVNRRKKKKNLILERLSQYQPKKFFQTPENCFRSDDRFSPGSAKRISCLDQILQQ